MSVALLLSVGILAYTGWRLWWSMIPALRFATHLANKIARGDLTTEVAIRANIAQQVWASKVAQLNVAFVEQVTAAAESQERQAQYLVQLVSQFKVKNLMANRTVPQSVGKMPVDNGSQAIIAPQIKSGAARAFASVEAESHDGWKEF